MSFVHNVNIHESALNYGGNLNLPVHLVSDEQKQPDSPQQIYKSGLPITNHNESSFIRRPQQASEAITGDFAPPSTQETQDFETNLDSQSYDSEVRMDGAQPEMDFAKPEYLGYSDSDPELFPAGRDDGLLSSPEGSIAGSDHSGSNRSRRQNMSQVS